MNKLNHDPWWQEHFFPQAGGKPCDYIARDGKTLIAVQESPQGTRGLYNEAMQLALSLANRPEIERACLVLLVSRLSMERVQREWTSIKGVLQPDVARRLSLAAIGKTDWWVEPNEELVRRIAKVFQATKDGGFDATATIVKPRAKQKHLEVLKVLIGRWLLREGSIPVGKLAEQVGCAYSTVKEALDQLRQRKVIVRNSDRSVELAKFPMSSWSEMLVLSRNLRETSIRASKWRED